MENDFTIAFLLGIIATFIAEAVIVLFKREFYDKRYLKRKFKNIIGTYVHDNGKVRVVHLIGNDFKAIGRERNGIEWESHLRYLGNSVLTGFYDWRPTSNLNAWGEHTLHILPNGNISVIWVNKGIDHEQKGRLIWKKVS
ncbi:MAG: hypothetical protein JW727_06455 [Candidatus Aenigmarchaeota archaeon]|nr:hypothetical protein [Candidatus Aenigmarchaeota archaeon]